MISLKRFTIGLCCAVAIVAPAHADNYGSTSTLIKVGNALIKSQRYNNQPINAASHAWYSLDADRTTKPASWTLVNPRANTILTQSVRDRFVALGATGLPSIGSRLTKADAPYWEVDIERASDQQIADYDVLLLAVDGTMSLTPREREALRRFVDKGGTLWVDMQNGATADLINPLPTPFSLNNNSGPIYIDQLSPLMNQPNTMTAGDLQFLQGRPGLVVSQVTNGQMGALIDNQQWIPSDSARINFVAGQSDASMTIGAAQIGDGYVVLTTHGISTVLNTGFPDTASNYGTFRASRAPQTFFFRGAAKLAINILGLNADFPSSGGGSRKMSSKPVEIPAPLMRRFRANIVPSGGTSPSISQGIMVVNDGGTLIALDANPGTDLDQNGDIDDGVVDAPDTGLDVLWQVDADAASSPVIANIGGANVPDQVIVTCTDGSVKAYPLYPTNATSPALLYQVQPPSAGDGASLSSPTIHESLGFVTDTDSNGRGRVWTFDPIAGGRVESPRPFAIERAPRLQKPAGSPTIGYIPIVDNSGGLDRVIYVPTKADPTNRIPAGLCSLWIGARGESPANITVAESGAIATLTLQTRASLQALPIYQPSGSSSLGMKLTFIDIPTGLPLTQAQTTGLLASNPVVNSVGNGIITVTVNTATGRRFKDGPLGVTNTAVRVDYTVNWGAPTAGPASAQPDQFVRGELQFPDVSTIKRSIIGSIAMGPSGAIFVVTSATNAGDEGGSVWALREEGRGDFKLMYRWELYEDAEIAVNSTAVPGGRLAYGPALIDYDGILAINPLQAILDQPMINPRFASGPVVRGDTLYVTAISGKRGLASQPYFTWVVALNADPQPAQLVLETTVQNFVVTQSDPARTESGVPAQSFLQPGQYSFEIDPNDTALVKRGRLRINNMMQATRGRIRDSIAINLPIAIRQNSQDILVEPEAGSNYDSRYVGGNAGGRWNPMRWYTCFNGVQANGTPVVTGNTMFMAGSSLLPGLINFGRFDAFQGLIYAFGIDVAATDTISPNVGRSWMNNYTGINSINSPIAARPWQKFLVQVLVNTPTDIRVNSYFKWPQYRGVRTFNDFIIRLNQATVEEPALGGIVAGNGAVGVWGGGSTYSFTRADFYVADEGRISRIDSSGNPIWSLDTTYQSGEEERSTPANNKRPLSAPWRVIPFAGNTFLVVDPGADRVMRLDNDGRELRTIEKFRVDPKFIPDGFANSDPRALKSPRDVATYTSIKTAANNPFTNAQPYEYWRHFLIADAGNQRVVELVDRYYYDNTRRRVGPVVEYGDPQSDEPGQLEQGLGVLLWHTSSAYSGRQYSYNSIGRATLKLTGGGKKEVFAFGFGNVEPGSRNAGIDNQGTGRGADAASGFSGILLYDPTTGGERLITEYQMPLIPGGVYYDKTTNSFTADPATNPDRAAGVKRIAGLSSVTLRYVTGGQLAVMFSDNTGVYEIVDNGSGAYQCRWMLPSEAYVVLRRAVTGPISTDNARQFRPLFARRLDSGEVIVCNAYSGYKLNGQQFGGEVLLVDGEFDTSNDDAQPGFSFTKRNLGFSNLSIRFELPPIQGIRGLLSPVFADRR